RPAAATLATIVHAVAEGFTPEAFAEQPELRTTAAVLQHVPPSAHVFAAAPLATAVDLCGVPRVSLQVVPDAERFTVCAALRVRPGSAAAAPRQLSIWARGVLHATPG